MRNQSLIASAEVLPLHATRPWRDHEALDHRRAIPADLPKQLRCELNSIPSTTQAPCLADSAADPSAAEVRQIINHRRLRSVYFDPTLFADPAWDMLLELYAAHLEYCNTSVTTLSEASCVPATTALRWISTLETAGLIARKRDPRDGRRIFVSLTPEGLNSMQSYFARARRS
jgi:hypothetical protein